MNLDDRWRTLLGDLESQGRYRRLAPPRGLDFSSNDYLGYGQRRKKTHDLSCSGLASRLLRGHHDIWNDVEATLADWHGAEAALIMNSGYVANEGLLSTLLEGEDFVASDELNHASLIDGIRLTRARRFIFRHNDLDHLESGLREARKQRRPGSALFIVTESLFGMEGDRAPLESITHLAEKYDAHVIVDEAHATGSFGPGGSGLVDDAGLRGRMLATVHTGGKALGVTGAYICGTRVLKEMLVNRCRHLIFTTALPPIVGAWWLEALDRIRQDDDARRRLHAAASFFRAALQRHGIPARGRDYIVPVVVGSDEAAVRVARRLQDAGYDIRAIRPPTVPSGTSRLRISIHADHDEPMLEELSTLLAQTLGEPGA